MRLGLVLHQPWKNLALGLYTRSCGMTNAPTALSLHDRGRQSRGAGMGTAYLFAVDFLAPHVPPVRGSKQDVQLVRAANLACQRHQAGLSDRFLFVVYGACDQSQVTAELGSYGFPVMDLRFVGEDDEEFCDDQGGVCRDWEVEEGIAEGLRRWVEVDHPGALPLAGPLVTSRDDLEAYREVAWRWIGLEADGSDFDWPFDTDAFAKLLPWTHTRRAATWLAVLQAGGDFNADDIECLPWEAFRAQAQAAALCEWLHGFEAASGNGYNHFDPDLAAQALGMDGVLLGYAAAMSGGTPVDRIQEAEDGSAARAGAVLAVTEKYRTEVLAALAILGGDGALFFTLYASIWPNYESCTEEAVDGLLGLREVEYGEIDAAWQFVSDCCHESA